MKRDPRPAPARNPSGFSPPRPGARRHGACFFRRMQNLRASALRLLFVASILVIACAGLARKSHATMGCADLRGEYTCPAYGTSQPASPMIVTQSTTDAGTRYTYTFTNLHPDGKPDEPVVSSSFYSEDGVVDPEGTRWQCQGETLTILPKGERKEIQVHYKDPGSGDYVVEYRKLKGAGEPREVQRCVAGPELAPAKF